MTAGKGKSGLHYQPQVHIGPGPLHQFLESEIHHRGKGGHGEKGRIGPPSHRQRNRNHGNGNPRDCQPPANPALSKDRDSNSQIVEPVGSELLQLTQGPFVPRKSRIHAGQCQQ